MLEIRNLHVHYGAIAAVRGIALDIRAGEIVALIGANGAGKSTVARAIAGLLPYGGEIRYEGRVLKPNDAEHNLRAGIALVPEGRGILGRMTVEENLLMGLYCRRDRRAGGDRSCRHAGAISDFGASAATRSRACSPAANSRCLRLRARCCRSRSCLLLDEPSLGLAPKLTDTVFGIVAGLRDAGLTVLLIEQKARQTLKVADRAYLLETGFVVTSGPADRLVHDSVVSETFLGGRAGPRGGEAGPI